VRYIISCILFISGNSVSEEQLFGSWKVNSLVYEGVTISFANTTNGSGSTLGVMCFSDSKECSPYLINGLTCDNDGKYPALVAVDNGLTSVNMECIHIEDRHLYSLPEEHLEYLISMNRYSVAFGVSDGKFKAAYFTLNGSAKAVIAARGIIDSAAEKNTKAKTKNYEDTYL